MIDNKRVIIKIGSSNLVTDQGKLNLQALSGFVQEISQLIHAGKEVALVSSGAVAAGMGQIDLEKKFLPHRKQILASIGQSHLMEKYRQFFAEFDLKVGQVLLIRDDLNDRETYLNARTTLLGLMEHQVVPIINENDVVTAGSFGGNDMLSAAAAGLVNADLLLLLSDVDGVYTHPPSHPQAKHIAQLNAEEVEQIQTGEESLLGTGGMAAKLTSAKLAANFGIPTIIANGKTQHIITDICTHGRTLGTFIQPKMTKLEARKRWLMYGIKPNGKLFIDAGARKALIENGTSLLPVGVTKIAGNFKRGDAVEIIFEDEALAQGIVNYSSQNAQQVLGKQTSEIETLFPDQPGYEIVHRDNLVLV